MAAKAEQNQTGFRSIFASLMPSTCRLSSLVDMFWEKNIRFASLTSHLLNGKLEKRGSHEQVSQRILHIVLISEFISIKKRTG